MIGLFHTKNLQPNGENEEQLEQFQRIVFQE